MTTDLKKLAEAATPGPWENRDGFVRAPNQGSELRGDSFTVSTSCAWIAECTRGEAFYNGKANAEYIAAANPQKILELLQEVETLRSCDVALKAWQSAFGTTQLTHAIARLEAAESKLTRTRQKTLEEAAKVCENHVTWLNYTNIGGANAEKMRTAATLLDAIRALQHTDGETKV